MAIVYIIPIKQRMNNTIKYITNKEKVKNESYGEKREDLINALDYIEKDFKTRNKEFVTGINCRVDGAYNQMQVTKEKYNKNGGILAYHIIHSYDKEDITPELAHKIGVEFAEELFGDRFEVIVATHTNTEHLHNHILVNSVSFVDGKKYYDNHENYSIMRKVNDNLCDEYGLKRLPEKECKKSKINYQNFYNHYEMKNNYKSSTKHDIDLAIAQAYSFIDFEQLMNKLNYDVMIRYGKISVRERSYKRNIRIERAFGEEYSIDNIKRRILEEQSIRVPFIEYYKFKKPRIYQKYCKSSYKKTKIKISKMARLYYHYCYLLRVYHNNPKTKSRAIALKVKHEVDKMNNYSKMAIFLDKYKINSLKELENLKIIKVEKMEDLICERKRLWNAKKKEKAEDKMIALKNKIDNLTEELNMVKNEMGLIEDIEDDYEETLQKVKDIEKTKAIENIKENQKEGRC